MICIIKFLWAFVFLCTFSKNSAVCVKDYHSQDTVIYKKYKLTYKSQKNNSIKQNSNIRALINKLEKDQKHSPSPFFIADNINEKNFLRRL